MYIPTVYLFVMHFLLIFPVRSWEPPVRQFGRDTTNFHLSRKYVTTEWKTAWYGYLLMSWFPQVTFTKQPYNHLRKRFPYLTNNGFDLLNRFLTYDPKKRITAEQALKHDYFTVSGLSRLHQPLQ